MHLSSSFTIPSFSFFNSSTLPLPIFPFFIGFPVLLTKLGALHQLQSLLHSNTNSPSTSSILSTPTFDTFQFHSIGPPLYILYSFSFLSSHPPSVHTYSIHSSMHYALRQICCSLLSAKVSGLMDDQSAKFSFNQQKFSHSFLD